MSNPIDDFINSAKTSHGCGFFEGNAKAVRYANRVSKSQRKKYHKYGVIPSALFDYLKEILGVRRKNNLTYMTRIEEGKSVPVKKDPTGELFELLRSTSYKDEESRSEGSILSREILLYDFPMLRRSQPSEQHLWDRMAMGFK